MSSLWPSSQRWCGSAAAFLELAAVAIVRVAEDASQLDSVATARFRPDAWRRAALNTEQFVRDTAGEYLPVAFLRDGTVAVVSPVQQERDRRFGFTWRRFQWR